MAESWKAKNRRWHANLGMALAVTMGLIALSCPFIAHKGGGELGEVLKKIHYGKFLPADIRWLWIDSQGLGLLFLVASGWLMHKKAVRKATNLAGDDPTSAGSSITFVGLGCRKVLDAGAALAESHGLRGFRCEAARFPSLKLEQERWIVFTAGSGEDCSTTVDLVLQTLAKMPAGRIRRLEFTIDPTLDPSQARALGEAMARIGAKPHGSAAAAPPKAGEITPPATQPVPA